MIWWEQTYDIMDMKKLYVYWKNTGILRNMTIEVTLFFKIMILWYKQYKRK